MKTLKELKEEISSKKVRIQLTYNGGYAIPEHISGIRTIGEVKSNGCFLINNKGEKSFMEYPKAKYMQYEGDILKIFSEYKEGKIDMIYRIIRHDDDTLKEIEELEKKQAEIKAIEDEIEKVIKELKDKKLELLNKRVELNCKIQSLKKEA